MFEFNISSSRLTRSYKIKIGNLSYSINKDKDGNIFVEGYLSVPVHFWYLPMEMQFDIVDRLVHE